MAAAVAACASIQSLAGQTSKLSRFTSVEIVDIDNERNEKGERIPPESLPALTRDLGIALAALHRFHRIGETTDDAVRPRAPEQVLQLRIKILSYTGSRNGTRIVAELTLLDRDTQQSVLVKRITARPGRLDMREGGFLAVTRKLVSAVTDAIEQNW